MIVAFTEEQISAVLNYDNARMLLLYLGIGSVLAAVAKGGGAKAFADWARKKAKSPKMSLIIMWLMDVVLSVDDELSAFTTGTAMTPLADSYGIPREKSAFMIRASAVAPATLWAARSMDCICGSSFGNFWVCRVRTRSSRIYEMCTVYVFPYRNYDYWIVSGNWIDSGFWKDEASGA